MTTRDFTGLTGARFEREASLSIREANAETRTVPASLSSEAPVARWFGMEVLSHEKDAVDLSRAAEGLPLLFGHSHDQPIGIVDNVRLKDGKLRGLLRFSSATGTTR